MGLNSGLSQQARRDQTGRMRRRELHTRRAPVRFLSHLALEFQLRAFVHSCMSRKFASALYPAPYASEMPLLVKPTCSPPFLAGTNEPSRKDMDESSLPRPSRAASAARQMHSQTSASPQRLSRRHTVVGAPYSRGRSCHRQPVMSTYRMPSTVRRSLACGRPVRAGGGSNGWMNTHCSSVRCTVVRWPC
jgi:hypothetical protein